MHNHNWLAARALLCSSCGDVVLFYFIVLRDAPIPFFKDRVRVPIFLSWYSSIPIPIPVFWDVAVFQVMTQ